MQPDAAVGDGGAGRADQRVTWETAAAAAPTPMAHAAIATATRSGPFLIRSVMGQSYRSSAAPNLASQPLRRGTG